MDEIVDMVNRIRLTLGRRDVLLGLALYVVFLPLLGIVPYWFPTDPGVASAASVRGYNNGIAHVMVVFASLIGIGTFALLERLGYLERGKSIAVADDRCTAVPFTARKLHFLEIAVVFLVFIVLYFPLFLSRYGPYTEDSYFMTVLHRMQAGQRPYVDFESLYGPLMLYMAYFWTKLFGYSMSSYYSLIALMEAVQFSILVAVLQRFFPNFRARFGIFVVLVVFLFNTLLGISWNGMRRLLPVYLIVLVASRPKSNRMLITVSLLLGMLFAYSHEFGIITLLTILTMYGFRVVSGQGFACILRALAISGVSLAVWLLCTLLLLGPDFSAYVEAAFFSLGRFSIEASFPFYWTVNSLATFGFLCLALVLVGRGMGRRAQTGISSGDSLLIGGLVYALVGLKSGLNRADMWHVATPMLVLIFAFVLPLPKSRFVYSRRVHRLAMTLLAVMVGTYLAALAPSGSYYARGLLLGLYDSITGQNPDQPGVVTRAPTIELERSHPDSDVLELGAYLADPMRRERPVVLYGRLWGLDKRIGVYKTIYPTDDFLLSDQSGYDVRGYLQERRDALVVIERQVFEQISGQSDLNQSREYVRVYPHTPTKEVLGWLSTIHFVAAEVESIEKAKRWERTVGSYIGSHYRKTAEFGDLIVLARPEESTLSVVHFVGLA